MADWIYLRCLRSYVVTVSLLKVRHIFLLAVQMWSPKKERPLESAQFLVQLPGGPSLCAPAAAGVQISPMF